MESSNIQTIVSVVAMVSMFLVIISSKEFYEANLAQCVQYNVLTITTCEAQSVGILGVTLK